MSGRKQCRALRLQLGASLGHIYTELDEKGKIHRIAHGVPNVTGSANKTDAEFMAAGFYRAVSVIGRLLLIPFFQVFTHDANQVPCSLHLGEGRCWLPALGASLFLGLDIGVQLALVYGLLLLPSGGCVRESEGWRRVLRGCDASDLGCGEALGNSAKQIKGILISQQHKNSKTCVLLSIIFSFIVLFLFLCSSCYFQSSS